VRVIAATHKNLAREVTPGPLPRRSVYRLAVVRLRVAPLRERKEDIPQLVQGFLDQLRVRYGERIPSSLAAVSLGKMARTTGRGTCASCATPSSAPRSKIPEPSTRPTPRQRQRRR